MPAAVTPHDRAVQLAGRMTDNFTAILTSFPQLNSLVIERQPNVTSNTLKHIGQLVNLQELTIDQCPGMNDEGFGVLAELHRLKTVHLNNCGAGDTAATALSDIPRIEVVRIAAISYPIQGWPNFPTRSPFVNFRFDRTCLQTPVCSPSDVSIGSNSCYFNRTR